MRFSLKPITPDDAKTISRWRYGGRYSVYDGDPTSVDSLLEPRLLYHSVYDEGGDLVGYFCFGEDARVSAGRNIYQREAALDMGLGMRPDLAGRGLGEEFVRAGLIYAKEVYSPPAFRLTVASFNHRAIRVYERAGFHKSETFGAPTLDGEPEWVLMRREAGVDPPRS